MKPSPISNFFLTKNSFLSLYLTFFVLFSFPFVATILGQDEIPTIAAYVSHKDVTTSLIKKYGYVVPTYLEKEWIQYPAVRKIEMAYQAAEHAQAGAGKNFLALISQDLARQYESVRHEINLKPLLNENSLPNQIRFIHPEVRVNSNLADHIKYQILTISKYTESGALGGTRGVLKHQFGLVDKMVYDVLSHSKSSKEALEMGLTKSTVPPSHQKRLADVMYKIDNTYGISSKPTFPNVTNVPPPTRAIPKDHIEGQDKPNNTIEKHEYGRFKEQSYPTSESKVFQKQIKTPKGWGGVIFGNEVIDATHLPKLKYIRFIENGYFSKDSLALSDLEFVFEDGSEYLETAVLVEDVLAANEILFHSDYNIGEGIGLAGIKNPISYGSLVKWESITNPVLSSYDSLVRWESVIHPVLSNLELGWSALSVDALPIASNDMLKYVKKNNTTDTGFQWVLNSNLATWKIIDVPLVITNLENKFLIERSDKSVLEVLPNAYITMHGFYKGKLWEGGEEVLGFYETIPILTQSIYEFHRINTFARTLALFRWAKEKGGVLIDAPKKTKYVQTPEAIFISKQRNILYYTIQEERDNFEILKKTILNEYSKIASSKKHLNCLQNIFQDRLQNYNTSLDSFWKYSFAPLQYQSQICSTTIYSPDLAIDIDQIKQQLNDSLKIDSLYGILKVNKANLEKIDEILYFKSWFLDNSPKSLKVKQEIKSSISYSKNLYLQEYENFDRKVTLTSNGDDEIPYLMFQKDLILISMGNLNDKVGNHTINNEDWLMWKKMYYSMHSILSTEQKVVQLLKRRYCMIAK